MAHQGMTSEEIRDRVRQADEVEFLYHQAEERRWRAEQRAKAPEILALLRQHIPGDRMGEVEEFLSTGYGCECLRGLVRR